MSTINRNQIGRTRIFRELVASVIATHGIDATATPVHATGSRAARFLEDYTPTPDVTLTGRPDVFLSVSASLAQGRYAPALAQAEQDAALAGAESAVHVAYRNNRDGSPDGMALMSVDTLARLVAGSQLKT
jgi:hypothetical protein